MSSQRDTIVLRRTSTLTVLALLTFLLLPRCLRAQPQATVGDAQHKRSVVGVNFADEPQAADDPNVLNVVATGVGADADKALQNAFSHAIEQAVGVLVATETIVENDRVVQDQILTYSRGFLQSHREVHRRQQDGLHYVMIQAAVSVHQLGEKLKANKIAVRPVAGRALASGIDREVLRRQQACQALRAAMADFLPEKFLSAEIVGQPEIGNRTGDKVQLAIACRLNVDVGNWAHIRSKLLPLLEGLALRRNETTYTHAPLGRGWTESPPLAATAWETFIVYLYRESSADYLIHRWDGFVLPTWLQPEIQAFTGRQLSRRIRVAFLDAADRVVAEDRHRVDVGTGRQIVGYDEVLNAARWLAIGPLLYNGQGFYQKLPHTESLTVSQDDLRRVVKCAVQIEKWTDE